MDLDFIIFPAPKSTHQAHPQAQILWVPKYEHLYPDFQGYKTRRNKKQEVILVQREDFEDEQYINQDDDKKQEHHQLKREFQLQPVPRFQWGPSNNNQDVASEHDDQTSSPQFEQSEHSPQTPSLATKILQLNSSSVKSKLIQSDSIKNDQKEETAEKQKRKTKAPQPTLSRSQPLINLPNELERHNQARKKKESFHRKSTGYIPCMYVDSGTGSPNVAIYFHANAEDIGLSYSFLLYLRNNFEMSVMAVEYPGYGLYRDGRSNAEQIQNDAEYVFNYITKRLGFEERHVMVFGRSIGSGPATYLSAKYRVGCLVLMSPFTSLQAVIRDYVGAWASKLVRERFDNLKNIAQVQSPIFILHGKRDEIIPYKQAEYLQKAALKGNASPHVWLELADEMDHINYRLYTDLINPLTEFLLAIRFFKKEAKAPKLPTALFREPQLS